MARNHLPDVSSEDLGSINSHTTFSITIPYYSDSNALVAQGGKLGPRVTLTHHPDVSVNHMGREKAKEIVRGYYLNDKDDVEIDISSLEVRLFEEDVEYQDKQVNAIYAEGQLIFDNCEN